MERARVAGAMLALFVLALVLMISGMQGSAGRILCVILAPGRLSIRDQSQRSGLIHTVVQSVTPPGNSTPTNSGGSMAL